MVRASLAKISRPVLYEPVARERLFKLLDELRRHPLVWITGPPGSGKTTLVASWLQARDTPAIWYQLDATDQDPTTLLHYLRLAVRSWRDKRPLLPPPGPELSRDIAGLTRRYLRTILSAFGREAILVLDDLQEAESDSALYTALADVAEDIPRGAQLILISRDRPHPVFARLEASRAMALLTADQLEFTLQETQSLICARGGLDSSVAQELHDLCRGWAAGLSLLIERSCRGELTSPVHASESLQDIFELFAAEIFARIPHGDQLTLLRLAELPHFSIQTAMQASGDEPTACVVEYLYRRNLFVDLLQGGSGSQDTTYQFHNLLRVFLRKRASTVFSPGELMAFRRRLADLLVESDAIEDAFAVLSEASDWDGAARVIYQHAETLLRQGRSQLLLDWVAKLPAQRRNEDAWLLYWSGAAHIGRHPGEARGILERAYAIATAEADDLCRVQSVAGIIETVFLEYAGFVRLDPWIAILDRLLPSVRFCDPNAELRVYAALVGAVLQRVGNRPAMQAQVEHTFTLIGEASSPNLKIAAATQLLRYGVLMGRMALAKRALALAQPVLSHPDVTSLRKGLCEQFAAWYYVNAQEETQAREMIECIERRAQEDGLYELRRFAAITGYWLEMSHGRKSEADRWAHALEQVMDPANAYDAACLAGIKAWSAMANGDRTAAMRFATEGLTLFDEAGSCWHRIFSRGILSWVCAEAKDFESALRWINEARSIAAQTDIHVLDAQFDQVDAIIAGERGEPLEKLVEGLFSRASQYGTALPLRFFPTVAPRLCGVALKGGIETAYVTALIRDWGWHSEDSTAEIWPWPVRMYTLGRFELHVRGKRVDFSGHAPRKVLALLKALLCLGVNSIRDRKLINALWSADESDASKAAFNVTLHRLRKLLQHPEAIAIGDGQVTLNTDICWIDAVAFDRLLDAPRSPERIERALALYRGNLLPEDHAEPWSSALRDKLCRRFVHEVIAIGTALESSQRWYDAIDLYQRALNADHLAEVFYQGLMRSYGALGRRPEAISVYQRLQRLLSVTLGLEPTAETKTLYRSLLSMNAEC